MFVKNMVFTTFGSITVKQKYKGSAKLWTRRTYTDLVTNTVYVEW